MSEKAPPPERPAWAKDLKGWSKRDDRINQAFIEVIGRPVDADGLATYRRAGFGTDKLKRDLATSPEAARRGVNPTDYGAKPVDPSEISQNLSPFYARWRQENPGATLYDSDVDHLRWAKSFTGGDLNAYDAMLRGEIRQMTQVTDKNQLASGFVISDAAVSRMGGSITLKGTNAGDFFIAPEGTEWTGGQAKKQGTRDGMAFFMATGNVTEGLLGAVGVKALDDVFYKIAPKELLASIDPTGIGARYIGGSRMNDRNVQTMMGMTGFKESEVRATQDVAFTVALAFATVASAGAAAGAATAAGMSAVQQGSKLVSGDTDKRSALTSVASATVGGAATGAGTSALSAGGNVVGQAGVQAASGNKVKWGRTAATAAGSAAFAGVGDSNPFIAGAAIMGLNSAAGRSFDRSLVSGLASGVATATGPGIAAGALAAGDYYSNRDVMSAALTGAGQYAYRAGKSAGLRVAGYATANIGAPSVRDRYAWANSSDVISDMFQLGQPRTSTMTRAELGAKWKDTVNGIPNLYKSAKAAITGKEVKT